MGRVEGDGERVEERVVYGFEYVVRGTISLEVVEAASQVNYRVFPTVVQKW